MGRLDELLKKLRSANRSAETTPTPTSGDTVAPPATKAESVDDSVAHTNGTDTARVDAITFFPLEDGAVPAFPPKPETEAWWKTAAVNPASVVPTGVGISPNDGMDEGADEAPSAEDDTSTVTFVPAPWWRMTPVETGISAETDFTVEQVAVPAVIEGIDDVDASVTVEVGQAPLLPTTIPAGMAPAAVQLGLDFGTSTTLVSLRSPDGVHVLEIGEETERSAMPSLAVIHAGANGDPEVAVVGEQALRYFGVGGYLVVRSVKRHLACRTGTCRVASAGVSETWCRGDGLIHTPWGDLPVERVVAAIVMEALRRAGYAEGRIKGLAPEIVVAGCPASAEFAERRALVEGLRAAGLTRLRFADLSEEPVLAGRALAALRELSAGVYLIYDLGGGSFDVAVLQLRDDRSAVVFAAGGLRSHGGDDMDSALLRVVERKLSDAGTLDPERRKYLASAEARRLAELAKQELTDVAETSMRVLDTTVPVTRSDFADQLRQEKFFERTRESVLEVYRRARLVLGRGTRHEDGSFDRIGEEHQCYNPVSGVVSDSIRNIDKSRLIREIDGFVAVGAATRAPFIRECLEDWAGEKLITRSALVLDAVCQGATQIGSGRDIQLDRLPWSIALAEHEGQERAVELLPAYTATIRLGGCVGPAADCAGLQPPLRLQLATADGEVQYKWAFERRIGTARLWLDVAGRLKIEQQTGTDPKNGQAHWQKEGVVSETPWQNDSHRAMIACEKALQEKIAELTAPSYLDDSSGTYRTVN